MKLFTLAIRSLRLLSKSGRFPVKSGTPASHQKILVVLATFFISFNGLQAVSPNTKGDGELDILFPEFVLRREGKLVYDAARDRTVRFGGTGYREGFPITSEWDGSTWIPVETEHTPPVQEGFAMAYDAERAQVVLFGGYPENGETWLYDGTDWTQVFPATSPSARAYHAMVYDSARKKVVLFGGAQEDQTHLNDTWEWNGSNWTQITPITFPTPRRDHQMAYDANRNVTVLFRGKEYFTSIFGTTLRTLTEMWEYNGTTWTEVTPASMPATNQTGHLLYNPSLNRIEFFTGFGGGNFDLWSYAGSTWTTASVSSGYSINSDNGSMAYRGSTGVAMISDLRNMFQWNGSQLLGLSPFSRTTLSKFVDVNGDGYEDRLAVGWLVNSSSGSSSRGKALYLNSAQGLAMNPVWTLGDGVEINSIAVGDLTGDGLPDAAFGSTGSKKIQVFANTGSGFGSSPVWESNSSYAINEVVLADVDGDGDLDLTAIITKFDGELLVFLNNDGTLSSAPSIRFLMPAAPDAESGFINHNVYKGSISWADVDYDGQLECAVGYYYVYGGGEFVIMLDLNEDLTGMTELFRLSGITAPLALTDVNGDVYPDLIGTRPGKGISLHRNVAGTLENNPVWTALPYGEDPLDIDVADFDGDGDPDIVLGYSASGSFGIGQTLYRNDGGSFSDYPQWRSKLVISSEGNYFGPAEWVDFDKDGVKDIALTSGIFLMSSPLRDVMPPLPPRFVTAHTPAAGSTDVTVSWQASDSDDVAIYEISRGIGSSVTSRYLIETVPATQTSFTYSHAGGGITNYFVRAIDTSGNIGYWSQAERIAIPTAQRTVGDAAPDFSISGNLLTGDINGDGRTDLFTYRNHTSGIWTDRSMAIYSVSPTGVFTLQWEAFTENESVYDHLPITLADATGNGKADLMISKIKEVDVGGGTLESRTVLEIYPALPSGFGFSTSPGGSIILPSDMNSIENASWGDANGDTVPDLALAGYGTNKTAALFLSAGSGTHTAPSWTSSQQNITALSFGNLTDDGKDDLLIAEDVNGGANATSSKLYLYHGTVSGPGATPNWEDLSPGESANGKPLHVSWADFNQNGKSDVTVFTQSACFAYRSTLETLPDSATLFVFESDINEPAHEMLGWANIDGWGTLDLYGSDTIIRNAGGKTGTLNSSNYSSTWESDTTHVYRDLAVNPPWNRLGSSYTDLGLALDLAGDDTAELITSNNGNMIFLNDSGDFPPTLQETPTELLVSPGTLVLPYPGATQMLTITAVYEDESTEVVSTDVTFNPGKMEDGTAIIRMNGNQVEAIQATVNGAIQLEIEWRGVSKNITVHVAERTPQPIALRIVPNGTTFTRAGEFLALSAIATLEGGQEIDVTPETVFTSQNPSVIQIQDAVAVAGQNGSSTLTATYGSLTANATLDTSIAVGLQSLQIKPATANLPEGGTQAFEVIAHYADDSSLSVTDLATLTSDAPAIASMNKQWATANSPGVTGIRASFSNMTALGTLAVNELDIAGEVLESIRILSLERTGSNPNVLQWQATPIIGTTRDFVVYTRTDLTQGTWTPVTSGLRGNPTGFMSWEDEVSTEEPVRFYVIETQTR